MLESARNSPRWAWLAVAAWITVIFATVPLVRRFQEWVAASLGSGAAFGFATIAVLAIGAVTGIIVLLRGAQRATGMQIAWLLCVTTIAVWWATRLWAQPEEAVHLVEYGVLGLFLGHALAFCEKSASRFLAAALIGTLIGLTDEFIQWLTPRRYFDFRDVFLNAGAVALAQLALWKGLTPGNSTEPPTCASFRLPVRAAMALVVALGLCLSLTPTRVFSWSERVGWPAFDGEDVVAEYGLRHEVPGIGIFKSRFSVNALKRVDQETGAEVARKLVEFTGSYPEFLRTYHMAIAPFAYEMRVHLHNRDHNYHLASKSTDDPEEAAYRLARASHENQILETFFGETLARSGRRLGPRRAARISHDAAAEIDFVSKAGSHLITSVNERQVWTACGLVVLILLISDRWIARRSAP